MATSPPCEVSVALNGYLGKSSFWNVVFGLSLGLSLEVASFAKDEEKPRLGLEIETAIIDPQIGQELTAPNDKTHLEFRRKILGNIKLQFGGRLTQDSDGAPVLEEATHDGVFRVDAEWAGNSKKRDGFEIVTPPLNETEVAKLENNYETILHKSGVGPGVKTSMQSNWEQRNLIPGFELKPGTAPGYGVRFEDIKNANISRIVDELLYLEVHFIQIFAAFAPKRMGNLINYFAVPYSIDQPGLLIELARLPKEERTYTKVRNVFLKYQQRERELTEGQGRTPWKYRAFNLDKFLQLKKETPTVVYPVLENRLADTPGTNREFKDHIDTSYALYKKGSESSITVEQVEAAHADYRKFAEAYRGKMPFASVIRLINQDILARANQKKFQNEFQDFINSLELTEGKSRPFYRARPSSFLSESFSVYNLFQNTTGVKFHGLELEVPKVSPIQTDPYSFGAEFEFEDTTGRLAASQLIPFLEKELSTESATGNREARSIPTLDLQEFLSQIYWERKTLGKSLKSVHMRVRIPNSIYEKIDKRNLDAWLARLGDWITALRASYRRSEFAFKTHTQLRTLVDFPDTWLSDGLVANRGTIRVIQLPDGKVDIEIRGLMDGVYTNAFEPDLLVVTLLTVLKGLQNPALITGDYVHRIASESVEPGRELRTILEPYLKKAGQTLESLAHAPETLLKGVLFPQMMVLPLVGYEYLPWVSDHDVQRIENATLIWKNRVWEIAQNQTLDSNTARVEFRKSIAEWVVDSQLESILFESLLGRYSETLSWEDVHLPQERLRGPFLRKLLALQMSDKNHSAIDLFIQSWFNRSEQDFKKTAKTLDKKALKILWDRLSPILPPETGRSLAKDLGFDLFFSKAQAIETQPVNILSLLSRAFPELYSPPELSRESTIERPSPVQTAEQVEAWLDDLAWSWRADQDFDASMKSVEHALKQIKNYNIETLSLRERKRLSERFLYLAQRSSRLGGGKTAKVRSSVMDLMHIALKVAPDEHRAAYFSDLVYSGAYFGDPEFASMFVDETIKLYEGQSANSRRARSEDDYREQSKFRLMARLCRDFREGLPKAVFVRLVKRLRKLGNDRDWFEDFSRASINGGKSYPELMREFRMIAGDLAKEFDLPHALAGMDAEMIARGIHPTCIDTFCNHENCGLGVAPPAFMNHAQALPH